MNVLRKGVSVIEVLFAMGVVAIGLLGVMSVVPVALHAIGRGTLFDQSGRAGQSALREFNTRGMARADQWIQYHAQNSSLPARGWTRVTWDPGFDGFWGSDADDDGFGALFDPFDGSEGLPLSVSNVREAGWTTTSGLPLDRLTDYPTPGVSFCIDPRFLVARDPASGGINFSVTRTLVNGNQVPVNANEFPYRVIAPQSGRETPLMKMQRVSLRSSFSAGPVGPNEGPLRRPHADRIFVIPDELVFDIPEESDNPPRARYLQGLDTNTNQQVPVLREHEGNYSWMATLVPERNQTGKVSDRYRLSIVVFYKRDPLLEMNTRNERVAYIPYEGFLSGGIGGGDVTLHSYLATPAVPNPDQELEVASGDWLLLSALLRREGANGLPQDVPYFRWYRVRGVDGAVIDPPNGNWVRNVTLDGANWPYESIRPHPTLERDNTRVTLVSDVVAVFERTISIETSADRSLQRP